MTSVNNTILLLFFTIINIVSVYPQKYTKGQLEKQRNSLSLEIKGVQTLLSNSKNKKKFIIERLETLNYKLILQNNLIGVINDELNLISNNIELNNLELINVERQQLLLKKQYSSMV